MKPTTLDEVIQEQLLDPDFKRAWEASEVQYQTVRKLIKERIKKKVSQRQMARKAKTTQAVISRVENLSMNPSLRLLERMAGALDKKLEVRLV